MRDQNISVRRCIYYEVALRTNVIDDFALLLLPIDPDHKPEIQIGGRAAWNDVGGPISGVGGGHAPNLETGQVQQIEEMRTPTVHVTKPELAAEQVIRGRGA